MFCECGTLITLPILVSETLKCQRCKRKIHTTPTSIFTTTRSFSEQKEVAVEHVESAKIKMTCVKCGADEMSYSTAQLRSADEGQTVFYFCEKCGHKETVQS